MRDPEAMMVIYACCFRVAWHGVAKEKAKHSFFQGQKGGNCPQF